MIYILFFIAIINLLISISNARRISDLEDKKSKSIW